MTPRQAHHKIILNGYSPIYQQMVESLQKRYPDQLAAHEKALKDPKGFATDMHQLLQGSRMMYYLAHQSGALDTIKNQEERQKQLGSSEDYLSIFKKSLGIQEDGKQI